MRTKQTPRLSDEKNPAYIFQGTDDELLRKAITHQIHLQDLAMKELANRGLSLKTGRWIGFKAAKKELGL